MKLIGVKFSIDGVTNKFVFSDGIYSIECVRTERSEKTIICIPSQIGCVRKCVFCMSGDFKRNLTPKEMVDISREAINYKQNSTVLISVMGEGEPSNNPGIMEFFNKAKKMADKFAVSTTGIRLDLFDKLNCFSDKLKVQLSLHAPNDELRERLLGKGLHTISETIYALNKYSGKKEINYVLIDKINDSIDNARELYSIVGRIPIKINTLQHPILIASKRQKEFIEVLRNLGLDVKEYRTDGFDIRASCGMMSYGLI